MNKKSLKTEIVKCGRDPDYFIRKYIRIQHPVRGLIAFDLFDYQSDLVRSYQDNRFNVILKARQLGISEATAAYALWLMLFRRDKNILVVATKRDTAKNIIRKVATAIKNLPKWLMLADVVKDNVFSIELNTGSRISAASSSKDAGRSEAVSLLILDEAAHIDKMDELWTGLLPTVQAGGKVIVLSTPKGVGNTFHEIYEKALLKENDFYPTKLMWWLHPERQVNLRDDPMRPGFKLSDWYDSATRPMSPREIAQELECNFNASGDSVISAESMDWIQENTVVHPFMFEYVDRNLHVFKSPEPWDRYFISADVARGDGKDFSAAHVWDVEKMEQVAEYKGKIPPDEFGELLCRMGSDYNGAIIVVENNSMGLSCLDRIRLNEYHSVYYSQKSDFRPGEVVNTAVYHPPMDKLVPGFTTSSKTRPLILAKFEEFVRKRMIIIKSSRTLDEMRKWIWHNSRAEAQTNYNDDLVMSAAIGCWIRETFLAPGFMNEEINLVMLSGTVLDRTDNVMIPGATKDPRFVKMNERLATAQHQNMYKITVAPGVVMDLSWLIK